MRSSLREFREIPYRHVRHVLRPIGKQNARYRHLKRSAIQTLQRPNPAKAIEMQIAELALLGGG